MKNFSVTPQVRANTGARAAYSFGDPNNRNLDTINLGRLTEGGARTPVDFDVSSEVVFGIFGKRGSGKSYTLGSMIESLCTKETATDIGKNSRRRGALLFDTLNIFWTTQNGLDSKSDNPHLKAQLQDLSRWRISVPELDVTVWYPKGYGSEFMPASYRELIIAPSDLTVDDWGEILDLNVYQDRMGQLLTEVHLKVTEEGWAENTPVSNYQISDLIDCLRHDQDIEDGYVEGTVRGLIQRLRAQQKLPVFGSVGSSLSEILVRGNLSIVLLNRVPDELRRVLVTILIRRIFDERSVASEIEKHINLNTNLQASDLKKMKERLDQLIPPSWVLIDEAQNVLPSERSVKSTETLVKFVREGRNHGLSFGFTTQQPSAIDQRIFAQVDTLVSHKLTVAADLKRVEDNLKSNSPATIKIGNSNLDLGDTIRALDPGQAIVSNTEADRTFVIEVRPRVCAHGGVGV